MNDPKPQIARSPLGPGEKISTHSVSFSAALAHKDLSSRHSAITSDLYSYHRYKMWTGKVRNAFDGAQVAKETPPGPVRALRGDMAVFTTAPSAPFRPLPPRRV